jgi:hypothetical protein
MKGPLTRRTAVKMAFGGAISVLAPTASLKALPPFSRVHNGYWWREISEDNKLGFIAGFVDGSRYVANVYSTAQKQAKQKLSQTNLQTANSISDFAEIHFGQYMEGLDLFYREFQNISIHADDAFAYVRDEINGTDPSMLEKRLSLLRATASLSTYEK